MKFNVRTSKHLHLPPKYGFALYMAAHSMYIESYGTHLMLIKYIPIAIKLWLIAALRIVLRLVGELSKLLSSPLLFLSGQ